MTRTLRFLRRTGRGLRSFLGIIFGGFWLIALYGLTVWLVVGSLATFQIRNELRQMDGAPSYADVGRAYEHYRNHERAIYADWDKPIRNSRDLYDRGTEKYREIQAAMRSAMGSHLEDYDMGPAFENLKVECSNWNPQTTNQACHLLREYNDLEKKYLSAQAQLGDVNYDALWAEAVTKASDLRAREKLAKHFDTYEFFAEVKADSEGALFDEFKFEGAFFSYMFLLNWPLQILVLLLTIIMGVLGSVLTMTWSFIKHDSDFTLRRFIILPFVGGMSAFIIFVFIKAGQLTVSAGSAPEPLNPFFLSFVGVISGLLSERAYARMAQVGSHFFRTDEENLRYGIRLREALDAAGVGQQELATYLQLSDEDTDKIIDGKAAAGTDQQQLIAACLRRDIRELFTDLPPKAAVVAPANPAAVAQPG
jgi:hypothetical protein